MKCSFCYTGMQGYKRNLSVAEIVGQYLLAFDWLRENVDKFALAPNIVFMGQGEPLQNFEAVKKSIEIFVDKSGLALSSRQITLSTAGYLPGLVKFSELPKVNLALSLHSTNETTRDELIPLNKTYPIKELFAVIDQLPRLKRQYITCEYLLIDGLNMEDSDVQGLTSLLKDRPAIINLIAFNPFPGSQYKRPTRKQVDDFRKKLVQNKLHVMVRTTKGAEILAACGQLNTRV